MSRQKDNRGVISRRDLLLEIKAVDIREFDIKDEARWDIQLIRADIFSGRCERDGAHAMRRKKVAHCFPDAVIVIHDIDYIFRRLHLAAFVFLGNEYARWSTWFALPGRFCLHRNGK